MSQKDIGNKIPIYKLKAGKEVEIIMMNGQYKINMTKTWLIGNIQDLKKL